MARALPNSQPIAYGNQAQPGDWQALRGELVSLLDQVEGQYVQASTGDPAFAGFAQRMRDLRYQVADVDPDDRHREALRSVKRQIERFNERGEPEPILNADNVLQTAIQQIRARTQIGPRGEESQPARVAPMMPAPAPAAAPRFDELASSMTGLSSRLVELEAELKAQRGNAAQVKEIADQVSQLSQVVELLAGAVGETGQVKRLESQIAGLAQIIGQAPKVDLTQLTERLDAVSATVDRLADLQVQQIQHVVREAEAAPQKDADATRSMRAIEAGVRNIYDRIDALETSVAVPPAELERISAAMAQITTRMGGENTRPERLLGLVDALNGRINEIEDRGEALGGLKGDIESLRTALLGSIEPRFVSIETQIGQLGEKLSTRSEGPGIAQLEAQIRQLVARMDQTGEQLSGLARLYSEEHQAAPDYEALANLAATRSFEAMSRTAPAPAPVPDFELLAELAADRAFAAMARQQTPPPPAPDFSVLADMIASRTADAVGRLPKPAAPDLEAIADLAASKTSSLVRGEPANGRMLSEAGLAEFEARITRLVDGLARTRPPEGFAGVQDGIGRVEERLAGLEAALARRAEERPAPAMASVAPPVAAAVTPSAPAAMPPATIEAAPKADFNAERDAMPRNPAVEAPLKEFGFPDLGPVRAALEAKNGPRKVHSGIAKSDETKSGEPTASAPHFDMEPITPEMAGGASRPKPTQPAPEAPPPDFDPAHIVRPPRPESSLDAPPPASFTTAEKLADTAPAVPEVSTSSRNTFIEAARRAAQRHDKSKAEPEVSSLIGRAFSNLQPADASGKPGKSGVGAKRAAPELVPPVTTKSSKAKTKAGKIMPRGSTTADAAQASDPAPMPTTEPAVAMARHDDTKESWLVRYRKPILLGASLIAVSFMTLNLVMQRLASHDGSTASVSAGPTPAATKPTANPAMRAPPPAPMSKTAPASKAPADTSGGDVTSTPKPVSEISPVAVPGDASAPEAAAEPGPRAISMTDPTTTASISPAMSFAPAAGANTAMPPALSTADSIAAAPVAASQGNTITPADGAGAESAAPVVTTASIGWTTNPGDTSTSTTPVPLESPVKVELPPQSLGPIDLRQAAADGDARAQFEIAAIYSEGRAVAQDFKNAAIWYERAAAQGFGPAQYRLGNLYENGKGVTKDLDQARLWYQRAAETGNRMAMHNLAALYAGGSEGKQDFASAAEWFERAADLGMKDSQFNLGMLYARGLGVPQSLETSYKWFALAASGGDADAIKARDNVARSLDAATVKKLAAQVAAWKVTPVNMVANFAPIGTWQKSFNPGPAITDKGVVTKVQVALMRLGYDVGTPDGHAGPKTAIAIKSFESSTGMSVVGAINPRLLAVLGSQPV